MNKKQKTKIEKLLKMLPIAIMLAIIVTIGMSLNAYALDYELDVDISADVADPDCYWSDGPGSELYVASGKTCTIDANESAKNLTGWTDYAVIVYTGGTLEIVGTANTTLTVDGNMHVEGTVNIGDGTTDTITNAIVTTNTLGNGDIFVMDTGSFNVTANAGTGENYFTSINNVLVGDELDTSAAQLNLQDSSTSNSVANLLSSSGDININDGRLAVGSVNLRRPLTETRHSTLDIASGAYLTVALYHNCSTYLCAIEVGYNSGGGATNAGDAILTVAGTLNVNANAADRSIFIGKDLYDGKLVVTPTGVMDVSESTASFAGPGPFDGPSNYFGVFSDDTYGLDIQGTLNTGMFLRNQNGAISVDSPGSTGILNAEQGYQQYSSLDIGIDDTMTITGEADIDGDSTVNGTLTVTQCAVVSNDGGESFTAGSAANIDINTDIDLSCALLGADEGLRIQGPNTTFSIADGATHDFDVWRQFTVDDGAYVDMSGEFTVNGRLFVQGDASELYIDDSTADSSSVNDVTVGSAIASPPTPPVLTINGDGALYLTNGDISVVGDTSTSLIDVYGTLSVNPASTGTGIEILDYGQLSIASSGTVNADGNGGGGSYFYVGGGTLDVDGTLNLSATNDMEMWVINGTTTANVYVSSTGLIDSKATPASNIGLNYDSGTLTIDNGGQMIFDDEIDIDTTNDMQIDGEMEGTDQIDFNGTTGTQEVGPSGEMRVVGAGNRYIDIHQDLGVLGKLNGDGGDGDIIISGAGTEVGGPGGTIVEGKDSYTYLLARDVLIYAGASIDVSNFINCHNPGSRTYGGSYGGEGAGGNTTTFGETKYTTAPDYSTLSSNPVGMCGFNVDGDVISYGGGAVYIEVHRDINIDGHILANGQGTSLTTEKGAGAGSGGLIVINHKGLNITHADTNADFTGSANIEANGGDATGTTNSYGGGGGRIIIDSIQFDDPDDDNTGVEPHYQYTGSLYATGGQSNNTMVDGFAASGTIVYLGDDNNPNGTLISDGGNRPPEAGKETLIPSSGSIIFDRIHARDGADILFAADPITDPVGCFATGTGSSVDLNGGVCTANPDKPDTLYINDSYTTALLGDEPWTNDPPPVGTTVNVSDYDPVFSIIPRNPENSSDVNKLWIQVTSNPGKFTTAGGCSVPTDCVWDAAVDLDNWTSLGNQSEDFEYAGSALSASTTYYVRVAFYDNGGTNLGLWTHMDMGNEYKFTTDAAYYNISNLCSDVITILDGVNPVKNSDGQRYGTGSCTFKIDTSTNAAWKVLFGKSSNGNIFSNTNGSNVLLNIDNDGTSDAQIDTTGDKSEEEYGFNISTGTNLVTGNVETDGTISQKYDNWTDVSGDSSYVFDIEDNGSEDKILEDNTLGAETAGEFDLNIYLNIANDTVGDDYSLETWMILTQGP